MMQWPRIMTAMVTPFDSNLEVNVDGAAELAKFLVGHGSGGLVLAGSTGEAFSLTLAEREALYRGVREAVGSNIPIWMGTGTNDTKTTRALSCEAAGWGVDGLLLVTPYYNKPSQAGLYRHFASVASEVAVPIMVYNVPSRTAVSINADTLTNLSRDFSTITAVKDASGSDEMVVRLTKETSLKIYSGDDASFLPAMAIGAYGIVSVASHLVGEEMERMTQAYLTGNHMLAAELYQTLWPVFRGIFYDTNPIPIKDMLNRLGFSVGGVRLPLVASEMPERAMGLWNALCSIKGLQPRAS